MQADRVRADIAWARARLVLRGRVGHGCKSDRERLLIRSRLITRVCALISRPVPLLVSPVFFYHDPRLKGYECRLLHDPQRAFNSPPPRETRPAAIHVRPNRTRRITSNYHRNFRFSNESMASQTSVLRICPTYVQVPTVFKIQRDRKAYRYGYCIKTNNKQTILYGEKLDSALSIVPKITDKFPDTLDLFLKRSDRTDRNDREFSRKRNYIRKQNRRFA